MAKFKEFSSPRQTDIINDLLGNHNSPYSIADIFKYLPYKIIFNGETGYLRVGTFDIVYSSLETEMQGHVVIAFNYLTSDIFDAFIMALQWIDNYRDKIITEYTYGNVREVF